MNVTIELKATANDPRRWLVLVSIGSCFGGLPRPCLAFGARSEGEALSIVGNLLAVASVTPSVNTSIAPADLSPVPSNDLSIGEETEVANAREGSSAPTAFVQERG